MADNAINLAVFGAGRMGQIHARTIRQNPNARLIALCDPLAEKITQIADELQVSVKDQATIFGDKTIDAVVISTPTSTHCGLLTKAIEAGKHVFCEKPIDLDIAQVEAVARLVERSDSKVAIGFHRRFDHHFMRLKSELEKQRLGDILMLNIFSKDPLAPPIDYLKHSGGLVRDMMIHDLDMMYYLLDDPVVEVYAQGTNRLDQAIEQIGDIDSAQVLMKTQQGILITISNARYCDYGYDQRIEIFGRKGRLNVDNVPIDCVGLSDRSGYHTPTNFPFFFERYQAAYRREMHHFIDYVNGDGDFLSTFASALKSSRLAESVVASLQHRKVIYL